VLVSDRGLGPHLLSFVHGMQPCLHEAGTRKQYQLTHTADGRMIVTEYIFAPLDSAALLELRTSETPEGEASTDLWLVSPKGELGLR
jgi:hypothetical protein